MKILKKTGTLLFVIVFLAESMGITFFHHICSGSDMHEVTLYPEFFSHAPACGCYEEEQNSNAGDGISMDSPSCCQNIILFCKLPVNTLPAEQTPITFNSGDHSILISALTEEYSSETTIETGVSFNSHAPPLSGTSLIHFLHQIKIPFPPSLA
ncbi:MAG: hypothetical protein WCO93_08460 [bacterium]